MSDLVIGRSPLKCVREIEAPGEKKRPDSEGFADLLQNKISEINHLQIEADQAISNVVLGNSGNVHEAIIALEKASISFTTMMEVRNKIVEAYQEIMRMQV
ncbi:MAG: flagellar hook-basal body complex protein FliE [Syntrophales bacterium]|jgi:flagellar hook-basal body complex protein FliE|nr:flagellar hook-basal body complex protein FliE [Syntrophales bacterium]MDY0043097.1 flagellar hook-basal body complex protein FliE [Syntrophales bacterium]